MKISILIPTRNFAPVKLVQAFDEQCRRISLENKGFDYEIIVADDASSDTTCLELLHEVFDANENVVIQAYSENLGRAVIRNRLVEMAHGELILFSDCDALPADDSFISKMLLHAEEADVICPMLTNPHPFDDRGCELRYRYELQAEQSGRRDWRYCNLQPYERFSTFCFMTRRAIMQQHKLCESLTLYGYEDVLLGKSFEKNHISVKYVDVKLVHMGINDNRTFLLHTNQAMQNLVSMQRDFSFNTPVVAAYSKLKKYGLTGFFTLLFSFFKPHLVRNLLGNTPNLRLFKIYKLGVFCEELRKISKR